MGARLSGGQRADAGSDAATLGREWATTVLNVTDARWHATSSTTVSHKDGDALVSLSWSVREGQGTPERVELEIDRRTGAVTYFARTQAHPTGQRAISAEQAREIALAVVDAGSQVESVQARSWNEPQWIVTTSRETGGPFGQQRTQFIIDARDGALLRTQST